MSNVLDNINSQLNEDILIKFDVNNNIALGNIILDFFEVNNSNENLCDILNQLLFFYINEQ